MKAALRSFCRHFDITWSAKQLVQSDSDNMDLFEHRLQDRYPLMIDGKNIYRRLDDMTMQNFLDAGTICVESLKRIIDRSECVMEVAFRRKEKKRANLANQRSLADAQAVALRRKIRIAY